MPELPHFILKFGRPEATACEDPAGYQPYRRIPVLIEKPAQIPAKVGVIGYDNADNPAPPLEHIIGAPR